MLDGFWETPLQIFEQIATFSHTLSEGRWTTLPDPPSRFADLQGVTLDPTSEVPDDHSGPPCGLGRTNQKRNPEVQDVGRAAPTPLRILVTALWLCHPLANRVGRAATTPLRVLHPPAQFSGDLALTPA